MSLNLTRIQTGRGTTETPRTPYHLSHLWFPAQLQILLLTLCLACAALKTGWIQQLFPLGCLDRSEKRFHILQLEWRLLPCKPPWEPSSPGVQGGNGMEMDLSHSAVCFRACFSLYFLISLSYYCHCILEATQARR